MISLSSFQHHSEIMRQIDITDKGAEIRDEGAPLPLNREYSQEAMRAQIALEDER
jgi:hypothetical protein